MAQLSFGSVVLFPALYHPQPPEKTGPRRYRRQQVTGACTSSSSGQAGKYPLAGLAFVNPDTSVTGLTV